MDEFIPLNLPPARLTTRRDGNSRQVFDRLRRRFVALTPEEWVRQHFTEFLITVRNYPAGLMGNEISLSLNGTARRCDTVIFGRDGHPWMIVEYKAPRVALTQKTFDQIVRYNMVLEARYLTVSNGLTHYCCEIDYPARSYRFLPDLPAWPGS